MGISILIPVYNFPVDSLIRSLAAQLSGSGQEGEIIVLDDGSLPGSAGDLESLQTLGHVSLITNQTNQGRMAARLTLAGKAKHDYLLFLDGDSEIIKDDFLLCYFKEAEQGRVLTSGW